MTRGRYPDHQIQREKRDLLAQLTLVYDRI